MLAQAVAGFLRLKDSFYEAGGDYFNGNGNLRGREVARDARNMLRYLRGNKNIRMLRHFKMFPDYCASFIKNIQMMDRNCPKHL